MAKYGVKAIFSDRHGGVSEGAYSSLNLGESVGDTNECVAQNLIRLCQSSDMPMPHQSQQVHGVQVLYCQGDGVRHSENADILIATNSGVALAVRTADCLPVVLVDIEAGVVAAVHAGWRGTAQNVVGVALDAMCSKGAYPAHILASFGPCIANCCFAVSAEVADILSQSCGVDVGVMQGGQVFADLAKANRHQLLARGVKHACIEISQPCTYCSVQPRYFSYRRDCGKTGRQLTMISLP
ncbi:MAG: peptidoglycan editing factor PgeF [Ghiorsea sp.]|nr:peptidoglycan editing factor PgeF [Ghiorsea sp.]